MATNASPVTVSTGHTLTIDTTRMLLSIAGPLETMDSIPDAEIHAACRAAGVVWDGSVVDETTYDLEWAPVTVRVTSHHEYAAIEGAREVMLTVIAKDGPDGIATGSAIVVPDEINGGWQVLGDSLDMWLSQSIVDLVGDRREVVEEIAAMACNGRVASREVRS